MNKIQIRNASRPATSTAGATEAAKQAAKRCDSFGFCTSVCPTYLETGDENDSPRGRIAIARRLFAGERLAAAEVNYLDRCLSCLSCQTTCAAGVDYRSIIDEARAQLYQKRLRSRAQRIVRWALLRSFTGPSLFALLDRLSALALRCGVAARIAESGTILGAALSLAQAQRRIASAAPSRAAESSASSQGDTLLFKGCVQARIAPQVNTSACRVLRHAGHRPVESAHGGCCGAMALHSGDVGLATRQAARVIEAVSPHLNSGPGHRIAVTASGCASFMKHYEALFETGSKMRGKAARVAAAVGDINTLAASARLQGAATARGIRVACHESCSLRHGLQAKGSAATLLRGVGFTVVEPPERDLCCGAGGVQNILDPGSGTFLGKRKSEALLSTSPQVIAHVNISCGLQIARFAPGVPVVHAIELVDWALGGPPPGGCEALQALPRQESAGPGPQGLQVDAEAIW